MDARRSHDQFRLLRCPIPGIVAVMAVSRRSFPRHTHEQFGIGVIQAGAQRSASGRGTVEAGPGDTITVNPGEVHDGVPVGDAGRSWRMLYFDPALIGAAAADMCEGEAHAFEFTRPALADDAVASIFHALFSAATTPADDAAALCAEALLPSLVERLMDVRREMPVPDAIGPALSLIDDAPTRSVSLADLARESGLSRFQTVRAFARATGLTPHAYLLQRRIDLARRLIAGGTPLAEAALASGFADQSHMTRLFVRNFGVSPGAYAAAVAA